MREIVIKNVPYGQPAAERAEAFGKILGFDFDGSTFVDKAGCQVYPNRGNSTVYPGRMIEVTPKTYTLLTKWLKNPELFEPGRQTILYFSYENNNPTGRTKVGALNIPKAKSIQHNLFERIKCWSGWCRLLGHWYDLAPYNVHQNTGKSYQCSRCGFLNAKI